MLNARVHMNRLVQHDNKNKTLTDRFYFYFHSRIQVEKYSEFSNVLFWFN